MLVVHNNTKPQILLGKFFPAGKFYLSYSWQKPTDQYHFCRIYAFEYGYEYYCMAYLPKHYGAYNLQAFKTTRFYLEDNDKLQWSGGGLTLERDFFRHRWFLRKNSFLNENDIDFPKKVLNAYDIFCEKRKNSW